MRPAVRPVLLIAGLLASSLPAVAGAPRAGASGVEMPSSALGSSALDSFWRWLTRFWQAGLYPAPAARPQAGCGIDPDGQPALSGGGYIRPDAGCGIDPNGLCVAAPARRMSVGGQGLH
jgi:hypothetical protein